MRAVLGSAYKVWNRMNVRLDASPSSMRATTTDVVLKWPLMTLTL